MTEFLKNNPIALRHCLLYEYLRRKTHNSAFTNFRDTIGSDVFTEKELRSIFCQFGKRKIEGHNRPITDMRDVIRNDKYALRACILYEFLKFKLAERGYKTSNLWPRSSLKRQEIQQNPSFALHSNFCKKLGDNPMGYPEFDSWFCRFLNGDFDFLNYERDTDIKMLIDMPIDILENIVEYLNVFDRVSLANTTHSFGSFVENQKIFCGKLEFTLNSRNAFISSGTETKNYENKPRWFWRFGDRINRPCYWKEAILDLKSILKLSKLHLEEFHFNLIKNDIPEQEDILETFEKAADALEVLNKQLHVKKLSFRAFSIKSLLKILPSLKPEYLKTIDINMNTDYLEDAMMTELIDLEQWKQAKYFNMRTTMYSSPISHFYHFKEFYVRLIELAVEDIREMKEILFNSPNFEKCAIRVHIPLDMNDIGQEFGDSIQGRPNIHHYPIPNSNEYFEIEVEFWNIEITRKNE